DYQMIVNIIEQRIKEKELKVELDIDDKLKNLLIYTDSIRYRQIMLNLINNSIKYTPKGGQIRVSIKHRELKDKQYLVNMISDNGVGMSESFMEKMYGKFAQEKNSESIDEGGTGLGLSITKNLVMLMGGNIKCSSVLNEGTTFTVTLPIDILKKDEKLSNSKRYTNDELSGKCVLLCEDNKMNALITERILEKAGVEVEKAVNGKEGIEMAKSFKYDAILMDIRMPEINGIDAAKKIRSFDKIVPIIALSANAYPEDIEMSIKSGMQGHIAKPINRDELYSTLIKWIN
ncbi:MAG TPA: ATP-binding protein, partial [Anaerovoracaceae bacterium]|nr:ATP-binding protein [Anaerovoracaceae bacterium]